MEAKKSDWFHPSLKPSTCSFSQGGGGSAKVHFSDEESHMSNYGD